MVYVRTADHDLSNVCSACHSPLPTASRHRTGQPTPAVWLLQGLPGQPHLSAAREEGILLGGERGGGLGYAPKRPLDGIKYCITFGTSINVNMKPVSLSAPISRATSDQAKRQHTPHECREHCINVRVYIRTSCKHPCQHQDGDQQLYSKCH